MKGSPVRVRASALPNSPTHAAAGSPCAHSANGPNSATSVVGLGDNAVPARKDFVDLVFVGHHRPAHNVTTDATGGGRISIRRDLLDVMAKVLDGRR
jgi:hypothetical protein